MLITTNTPMNFFLESGSYFFERISPEFAQTPELCGATIALFDIDSAPALSGA